MKRNDRLGLRLESDETAERRFRVVVDDIVAYDTNVQASAEAEYAEVLTERDKPFADRRARERDFMTGERVRAEMVARTRGSAAKNKGGKGGRGGV